jgi:hypothetical protein
MQSPGLFVTTALRIARSSIAITLSVDLLARFSTRKL